MMLPMATRTITLPSSLPPTDGDGDHLRCVLCGVAPVAQPFKVLKRIIHVITVFVVNLALACFATPLTWTSWPQALGQFRRTAASFCLPLRVFALRHSLATSAAVDQFLEPVAFSTASLSVWRVLPFWSERNLADWASLHSVSRYHFAAIILPKRHRVETV